jgi:hypothetical protein
MAKAFSSEQLEQLNAKMTSGKFREAVIFTRNQDNPNIKEYFIRHGRPIVFKGNTYQPLDMAWAGMKVSSSMELPSNQVVVSNLGGSINDYLEDPEVEIEGNDVTLQILYIDKFGQVSLVDEMLFQVEVVVADYHKAATFHLGVNYSLNDVVPRQTIEKQEFPGIRDDVIRVGT